MTPIEERMKLWRSLIDHPHYKQFNLVLCELVCPIRAKYKFKRWWRQYREDVSGFYL